MTPARPNNDSQPRTALLVIDVQSGFTHPSYWGPSRSNASFETNLTNILSSYRSLISSTSTSNTNTPSPHKIIHISHSSLSPSSPLHPSSPGHQFLPFALPLPDETVLNKTVNSAFIGTPLSSILAAHFSAEPKSQARLYIAGLSTDHCVSTTTRMAANLGVCDGGVGKGGKEGGVVLIGDATAAWRKPAGEWDAETVQAVHVESLREFADVKGSREVVEEWRAWTADEDV